MNDLLLFKDISSLFSLQTQSVPLDRLSSDPVKVTLLVRFLLPPPPPQGPSSMDSPPPHRPGHIQAHSLQLRHICPLVCIMTPLWVVPQTKQCLAGVPLWSGWHLRVTMTSLIPLVNGYQCKKRVVLKRLYTFGDIKKHK